MRRGSDGEGSYIDSGKGLGHGQFVLLMPGLSDNTEYELMRKEAEQNEKL
jgi:hypothetical protein